MPDAALLFPYLDRFCEAMLVDLADSPDDEQVPIGRMFIELFEADEKGYEYAEDLADLYLTAGEIRNRMRRAREELIAGAE